MTYHHMLIITFNYILITSEWRSRVDASVEIGRCIIEQSSHAVTRRELLQRGSERKTTEMFLYTMPAFCWSGGRGGGVLASLIRETQRDVKP